MGFQSKTYSLSDEVVAAIEDAKAKGETPNKFLRRVLGIDARAGQYCANLTAEEMSGETVAVEPERYETRQMRQKGDAKR